MAGVSASFLYSDTPSYRFCKDASHSGRSATGSRLPASELPQADVIVNPNQPGCGFESKSIAGVGVMFYVLLALRSELRTRGVFTAQNQPKLDTLLPMVAMGTVADVVRLDANNRRLVAQGLKRVRAGALPAGMAGLFSAAGRSAPVATTFDFGFALGPRINAAGRLSDMTLGIECLLTDDPQKAAELARDANVGELFLIHFGSGHHHRAEEMLAAARAIFPATRMQFGAATH